MGERGEVEGADLRTDEGGKMVKAVPVGDVRVRGACPDRLVAAGHPRRRKITTVRDRPLDLRRGQRHVRLARDLGVDEAEDIGEGQRDPARRVRGTGVALG